MQIFADRFLTLNLTFVFAFVGHETPVEFISSAHTTSLLGFTSAFYNRGNYQTAIECNLTHDLLT